MHKSKFSCIRDNLTIRGTEYRPKGDKLSAVILSHGFMANQMTIKKYAKKFVDLGFAAFCFDFNGGGLLSKSDGETTDMSVLTEKEDLLKVIEYVKELPYINEKEIILVGFSQGGFVSAMVAKELDDQISKLILFYPALCIPDDARKGEMMAAKFDPENVPDTFRCGPMKLGKIYPESVMDMNAFEEVKGYNGPVLIIHGTEDDIVDISYSEKAFNLYTEGKYIDSNETNKVLPSTKHQFLAIEGARHGFSKDYDNIAMFAVKQFLNKRAKILEIDVELKEESKERKGIFITKKLPFEGESNSLYFKGEILPGGCDVQKFKLFKIIEFRAEYTLEGIDFSGQKCKIDVVNIFDGKKWSPSINTDSNALDFLNNTKLECILQGRKKGPIVRIYSKIPN